MLAKRILLLFLIALTFAVYGCAPKMVSSNAAVYQTGHLYASSARDVDAVYQASLKAMEKLQLNVTSKVKDAFGAKVIAKSSDDKIVGIHIKPVQDKKTEYSIKVGAFGNEDRSLAIYKEIESALGTPVSK